MTAPAAAKYSWSAMPLEQLNPQLSRRIVTGKQVMVAHVYLKAGCVVPKHHHLNEQVTYVLEGALRLWVGDTGVGMREAATPGTGLTNLRQRLQAFFGPPARLELSEQAPHGVRAEIIIPS